KVIISASGMCEAGRVCHHLKYNLWKENCTVLFVGYQAQGTLGRRILDGAESVKIYGDEIAVNARIESLSGISGHADKRGLLRFVESMEKKPSMVFVNHGEDASATDFAKSVEEEFGVTANAPYSGTVYDLKEGRFEYVAKPVPVKRNSAQTVSFSKNRVEFKSLTDAAKKLTDFISSLDSIPNKEKKALRKDILDLIEKYKR
ncbi:MAG: MBL fold metallo-hydrolase, partial [Ruminococcus sp.]|nr:MBL fold metallo-hydrolase [Ruminococcus sp.]